VLAEARRRLPGLGLAEALRAFLERRDWAGHRVLVLQQLEPLGERPRCEERRQFRRHRFLIGFVVARRQVRALEKLAQP
jgi:hypothetical protein